MENKFKPLRKPFKERVRNFTQSLLFWKGRKKGMIHTRNITWDDIRMIFFPKDHNEKYEYLGYIYMNKYGPTGKVSRYYEALMPLVLAMDKKAKPWWCPRWFLRFLEVFGNDRSIVRVRNWNLHRLHSKITGGYRFVDWKTKWEWYDLRISIYADKDLNDMADQIERDFYRNGRRKELNEALVERGLDPENFNSMSNRELDEFLNPEKQ
jgi:hypothetical protein